MAVQMENFLAHGHPSQEVPIRQSKLTEVQVVLILTEADADRPIMAILSP